MPRGKWTRTPEFREKMRQIWVKKQEVIAEKEAEYRKHRHVAAMVSSLRRKHDRA